MSTIKANAILDASGGNTVTINSVTPTAYNTMGKNLIINGNMEIAQRGTSASLTSGLVFCVDRFKHTANTGGAGTASQQSFTAGQTDVPNATYYLRHDQTTGGSSAPSVRQYIEDVNTYQGQTVVLSYYAKVGSGTLTVTPLIKQNFGSGGSSLVSVSSSPSTHTITTSWQKFTCTFSLPSVSGKTIGSSNSLQMWLEFPASTTFTFDFTQVQLEAGSVATEFERRPYGTELVLCQRYYQYYNNSERVPAWVGPGTSTHVLTANVLKVPMRAAPTVSLSGAASFDAYFLSTYTQSSAGIIRNTGSTDCVVLIYPNFTGLPSNAAGAITIATTSISAEL